MSSHALYSCGAQGSSCPFEGRFLVSFARSIVENRAADIIHFREREGDIGNWAQYRKQMDQSAHFTLIIALRVRPDNARRPAALAGLED